MRRLATLAAAALALAVAAAAPTVALAAGGTTMHRLYNPNSGEHFYTANAGEKDSLVRVGWSYEGVGWTAPAKSSEPVYRLYNENAGDHHYTMSAGEKDSLVRVGWKYEGIGWYSDTARGQALYRQYNPNAVSGSHNYTTSKGENDSLVRLGWKAEGIGWYGVRASGGSTANTQTGTTKPRQQTKYVYVNYTVNEGSSVNVNDLLAAQGVHDVVKQLYYDGGYADCWNISKQAIKAVKFDGTGATGCDVQVTYQTDTASVTVYLSMRDTSTHYATGKTITAQDAPDYVTTLHGKSVKLTEQGKCQWAKHNGRTVAGFDFDGSKGYGLDFKSFSENVYGKVSDFNDPITHVTHQANMGDAVGSSTIEGLTDSYNPNNMCLPGYAGLNPDGSAKKVPIVIPGYGQFALGTPEATEAFGKYLEDIAVANQATYWDICETYGTSQVFYNYRGKDYRADFTLYGDCNGNYYEYVRRCGLPYSDHTSAKWIVSQRYETFGIGQYCPTNILRQNRYWCVWQDQLH